MTWETYQGGTYTLYGPTIVGGSLDKTVEPFDPDVRLDLPVTPTSDGAVIGSGLVYGHLDGKPTLWPVTLRAANGKASLHGHKPLPTLDTARIHARFNYASGQAS